MWYNSPNIKKMAAAICRRRLALDRCAAAGGGEFRPARTGKRKNEKVKERLTGALLLFMVFFHRKGRLFVVPRVRICYDKYNGKELSQMKNHLSRLPAAALLLPCLSLPVQAAAIKPEELDALYYGAYITAGALLYILAGKLWKKFMDRRK